MKKIMLIVIALVLALAMILPLDLTAAAAGSTVVGRVSGISVGTAPIISGDVKLMSDGTVQGDWTWTLFEYVGSAVSFRHEELTSLSFPAANAAILIGQFCCEDLPLDFMSHHENLCTLVFEITEMPDLNVSDIATESNPSGLPEVLPPGKDLPATFGNDTLKVYSADKQLIAKVKGNFKVETFNR